jgi:hypothetical protein
MLVSRARCRLLDNNICTRCDVTERCDATCTRQASSAFKGPGHTPCWTRPCQRICYMHWRLCARGRAARSKRANPQPQRLNTHAEASSCNAAREPSSAPLWWAGHVLVLSHARHQRQHQFLHVKLCLHVSRNERLFHVSPGVHRMASRGSQAEKARHGTAIARSPRFKIISAGDVGVGKSCLIKRCADTHSTQR